MVSFLDLETPTTTTAAPRKKRISARAPTRVRKVPAKEGRTIEIELQPDYDFLGLGLDDFVTTSPSQHGGNNDSASASNGKRSEKRNGYDYESSSDVAAPVHHRAPEIDSEILYEGITSAPHPASSNAHAAASLQKGAQKSPVMTVSTNKPKQAAKATNKKKSKSSTMPGFIKDEELDAHVANLSLRRLPSSQRKLTRRIRSKSAKITRRKTNAETMYKRSPAVPDSLIEYTREIHAISRVTPKEEKELGTKTQEAIRLQNLHNDLQSKYGRDPTDVEWCAAAGKINVVALKEAIADGMEAKNQLVASNLRMVQRVVNLYIRNGLGSEYNAGDLMQDGTVALIRAAEKYEPDRGFRFSTYAMYWIRSAVKRSQTSQSRIINVPQRIHETHKRIHKEEARLRKELGREPSKPELAEACDISIMQLAKCRKAMHQVTFSLDAELQNHRKPNNGGSRKDTMYDIVEGKVDETEYERTQRLLMRDHLIGTLRRYLTPHEVDLLLLRYGLMDERALPTGMSGPLTIAEVSKLVGLKPDKVRRIIINSQKQLKHLMRDWEDFEYELA
eukprot:CAMPEP_0172301970 /NCGR_PEP_ID=MMETSP1058-20130122/3762_1 /TAXON_ID=83371 /ORGANISM="Detonula confervacea, Strain CCMP 353" /LENGTH=560 /DNA_ID=CAMNT_0013012293 /DNA_START=388 /DNA_END=2070 /DNA_ORIENTATION=-